MSSFTFFAVGNGRWDFIILIIKDNKILNNINTLRDG